MSPFPVLGGYAMRWGETTFLGREGLREVFMPNSLRARDPARLAVYAHHHVPTDLDRIGFAQAWPDAEGLWFQVVGPRATAGTYEILRRLARLDRLGQYPPRLGVSVGGLKIVTVSDRHGPGERVILSATCGHVALGIEDPAYRTAWCGVLDAPRTPPRARPRRSPGRLSGRVIEEDGRRFLVRVGTEPVCVPSGAFV